MKLFQLHHLRIPLSEGAKLVLYASDTLLHRNMDHSEDYIALKMDINSVSMKATT